MDVDGRVLDARGAPLSGVRVFLAPLTILNGGVYRETRTDSGGRFAFPDVSASDQMSGMVDPPPEWVPATFALTPGTGSAHLGDIWLSPNTTLRVAVETAAGKRFHGEPGEVDVHLLPTGNYLAMHIARNYANGVFTFNYISYLEADLTVSFHGKRYKAPMRFEPGQRNRFVVARIPQGEAKNDEPEKLEILEMVRPPKTEPHRAYEGVVQAPDGSPLEGAVVSAVGESGFNGVQRWATAVTGPDGRYRLAEPPGGTYRTFVDLVAGDPWISEEAQAGGGAHDFRIADAIALELGADVPRAATGARLRVRWWHDALGWQTLGQTKTWIVTGMVERTKDRPADEPYAWVVGDLPGYFPIAARLTLQEGGGVRPKPMAQRFRFADSPLRTLEVRSLGKPLAGATVDLVRIDDPGELQGIPLATYTTGANGRLQLAGAPDGIYGVFVYARGHAPAHSIWEPGAPLVLTLSPPAGGSLELDGAVRGERISVIPSSSTEPVAVVNATGNPVSLPLPPGDYDISAVDESDHLAAGARVTLAGRTTRATLAARIPGEIRVEFPNRNSEWAVSVWREGPRTIPIDSPRDFQEQQLVQAGKGESGATVKVNTSGLYRVAVGRSEAPVGLVRTVEITIGRRVVLKVPELGAALSGTAPEAAPGKTRKGTQLYLRSADRDGWDVEVEPREVGSDGGFEVESLPAGRYYAWQHVFTTVGEAHGKLGPAAADVCRKHEWAGVPVVLEAGGKAALKDLAATPAGNVKVRVIDAGGQPVPSAYIFLRDQNPEFWIRDDEAAAGAASEAPIAHVVNGAAELRDVRAGGLDFELLAGTGRVYSVVAQVEPGRLLEVRLPKEDR